MRMHMRRFTRLTNGFRKKVDNHAAAIALHLMYYNFVKTHQSLRMTPAMAAGVTSSPWTVEDIVRLVEERERRRREENYGAAEGAGRRVGKRQAFSVVFKLMGVNPPWNLQEWFHVAFYRIQRGDRLLDLYLINNLLTKIC